MPLTDQTIAFLGSGNMCEAIIAGLLRDGSAAPERIVTADIRPERLAELRDRYGTTPAADNEAAARAADILVLAVKPQMFAEAAAGLKGGLRPGALVLSIMAGTAIETIRRQLGHEAIVRSMPNTPAMIGEGMSVWVATPAVSEAQKAAAAAILSACGRALEVAEEKYLDMATAINGSGPGYVFLILEAMVDAGVQMGFSREAASELVLQTVLGSARYAQASGLHLADLRNRVTSPAGTTAAGLAALERGNIRATLADAILAAYRRAQELGQK